MSLILDALNRSRQDAAAVPGLDTQHRVEPLAAERRPYLLWAALALCGVVIVWLVVDRLRVPAAPVEDIGAPVAQLSQNLGSAVSSATNELKARAAAAEQVQQPVAPAPVPVSAAAPAQQTESSVAAANQGGKPTAPQVEAAPARPDPRRVAASEIVRAAPVAPQPAVQDDEVAQLYAHPDAGEEAGTATRSPAHSASSATEQPVDIDKVLKLAEEEMKNAKLEDNGVPFLADLSQQTKDSIPTIYYQKHDYSNDPAVSSVTLNGATVKAGGSPVPGLKVDQILRDSVVLSFQGTQFRLRALSSWVNL